MMARWINNWLKINKAYLYFKELPGVFGYLSAREQQAIKSWGIELCFPFVIMNRLIGIIFLGRKENHEFFSRDELSFLMMIAAQIGIALENALLYRELRERFL